MITIKKTQFNPLYQKSCKDWKKKFREKFENQFLSDELEFEESFLNEIQSACTPEQLEIFNSIFKDYVKEKTDLFKITTYSEVCKALKEKELIIEDFKNLPEYMQKKSLNQAKISQLERLFNDGWVPDCKNEDQKKYYPYFGSVSGGGFVLDYVGCCGYIFGDLPGYYKNEKTAKHIGTHFIDIYKELL